MPYSQQHKHETRERILEAAARALREAGIHGVGIGELMARAGLTHGGFYAHFPSKDALVAQACAHGLAESSERLLPRVGATGDEARREALRGFIRAYLSRRHRDAPETGCTLPALAADVARSPAAVREAFTDGLKGYLDRLASFLSADGAEGDTAQRDALVLLSGMAGAMLLARAVDDEHLSDRMLAAARAHFTAAFAAPSATAGTAGGAGADTHEISLPA